MVPSIQGTKGNAHSPAGQPRGMIDLTCAANPGGYWQEGRPEQAMPDRRNRRALLLLLLLAWSEARQELCPLPVATTRSWGEEGPQAPATIIVSMSYEEVCCRPPLCMDASSAGLFQAPQESVRSSSPGGSLGRQGGKAAAGFFIRRHKSWPGHFSPPPKESLSPTPHPEKLPALLLYLQLRGIFIEAPNVLQEDVSIAPVIQGQEVVVGQFDQQVTNHFGHRLGHGREAPIENPMEVVVCVVHGVQEQVWPRVLQEKLSDAGEGGSCSPGATKAAAGRGGSVHRGLLPAGQFLENFATLNLLKHASTS